MSAGSSAWAGVALAGTATGYALISRRLSGTVVSAPMVFTGVGLAVGPLGLGLLSLTGEPGPIRALLEVTLAVVLFSDAVGVQARALRREDFLPLRLLGIGLPLTMALGWLLAAPLLPGLGIWELALVGIVLAPTDAALGQAAIADRRVPGLVRQGLNVESGLNDGMSLPFFVLALAAAAPSVEPGHGALEVFVRALVFSAALGLAVGWAAGRLLTGALRRGWADDAWRQLGVVAVALLGYALAVVVDGSGFIAAWVAGLAFGGALRTGAPQGGALPGTVGFGEHLATLLTSVSFFVFGAVLLGPTLQHLRWQPVVYAVLSLTVVRLLPVALALAGSRLAVPTVAYVGWFGPRGLASIVLGLLVVEAGPPHVGLIGDAVALTVGLSVLLHGASSVPFAARYGRWYAAVIRRRPGIREAAEDGAGPPPGVRRPAPAGGSVDGSIQREDAPAMAKDEDTLFVLTAAYDDVDSAVRDYEAVKELYREVRSSHDFDAAVVAKDDRGRVRIVKKHEQPTRHGAAVGLGWGLAAGVVAVLFPPIGIGIATAGGAGAAIGAIAGHVSGGLSRGDLKELGDSLDAGTAGLVVVYATNMADHVAATIKAADRMVAKATDMAADQLADELRAAEQEPARLPEQRTPAAEEQAAPKAPAAPKATT